MSGPVGKVVRWLRGVRARLVTTVVLASVVIAGAGVLVFSVILARGLNGNLDGSLRTTADSVAVDVRAGDIAQGSGAPRIAGPGERRHPLPGLLAVYDPQGRLVHAEPLVLPANPLTTTPARTRSGYRTSRYAGQSFRILSTRVHTGAGNWLVVVGQDRKPTNDATQDARQALYVVVPVGIILAGVGAWLLAGAALRPVDRMRKDAARLSETTVPGTITVPATSDSLHALAQTFNALLDRLHSSLARQRDLVADAGHELRTPLAVLQTELDTAVRPNRTRDDLVDSITHAREEVARLATLADDLLLLAQAGGPGPMIGTDLTDVAELIDTTVAAHQDRFARAAIVLVARADAAADPLLADVDPIALRRILDNLLTNAMRHTPGGGRVEITVGIVDALLRIRVEDTGDGIPEDFLPHAFDRFTRADQSRSRNSTSSGSGLGLAIVDALVAEHAGNVMITNRESGGTRVEVRLPLTHWPNDVEDEAGP